MVIVKRHKSVAGDLLGYTVKDKGKTLYLTVNEVLPLKPFITNALFSDTIPGAVRAKDGHRIETVIGIPKDVREKFKGGVNFGVMPAGYLGNDFVKTCRRIREYARLGRFRVDKTEHWHLEGKNLHLFKMIKCCGWTLKGYLQQYLSNLQPYSLSKYTGEGAGRNDLWVVDIGYGFTLVIKFTVVNAVDGIVISFHESVVGGIRVTGKANQLKGKICAVFIDGVSGCEVCFTVQRGFLIKQFKVMTKAVQGDIAAIPYDTIDMVFYEVLERYMSELTDLYGSGRAFVSLGNLSGGIGKFSITSYGVSPLNALSLMVDVAGIRGERYKLVDSPYMEAVVSGLLDELPDAAVLKYSEAIKDRYSIDMGYQNYALDIIRSTFGLRLNLVNKQYLSDDKKGK